MAKHRSLGNALLTSDQMAFIKGSPSTQVDSPIDDLPPVQAKAEVGPVVELNPDTTRPVTSLKPEKTIVTEVMPTKDEPIARGVGATSDEYLVAVTTRLQARTAEALRRAHLEQKLNRREPATQQEIIEVAVQQWLRDNSYFD